MHIVVLDTNVLLADPGVVFAFPDAEIVIPETVLGELDKLKTSRADPDLRFRGREISRILFELSEQGSLSGGIDLPDGGKLRVASFDPNINTPDGLSTRNADDRILAVACQVCTAESDGLTLITNDLNMLLKAQTLGLAVERYSDGVEASFSRRYIIRPFQRYKIPLTILAIAAAIFAAIIVLVLISPSSSTTHITSVPTEFREQLAPSEQKILDYLTKLAANEADLDTRLALANLYYELRLQTGTISYSTLAIRHYERFLEVKPDDTGVRADLAASYFYSGQTDRAIQEALRVFEQEPDHIQANFNLGIFYWKGRQEYATAAAQFRKVIELTTHGDEQAQNINKEAQNSLAQILQEAEAHGEPLPQEGTY